MVRQSLFVCGALCEGMVKSGLEIRCESERQWATAYVLSPAKLPVGVTPIDKNDWQTDLQKRPPLPERLSDRQRTYILKLGASRGREIVPIQLDLYCQLVGLEIVVDKGRRLALTKLGKELYKHLR